MLIPQTEHIARGCEKCKKGIPAGTQYYFDTVTRNRYHAECKPLDIAVVDKRKPAARVQVRQ